MRVGERRVADNLGTIARPEPRAGDDRRSALMTVFEDLEEVALLRLGKDRETPVVQDQELDAREGFEQAAIAAVAACERQRLEQARRPMVEDAFPIPASLVAESAGNPAFADAGRPGD